MLRGLPKRGSSALLAPIQPGSLKGLHLVVTDISEALEALVERGVAVGEITDFKSAKYAGVSGDPDGNLWLLREFPAELRRPGQAFYQWGD
jgi:hypothetical protein